MMNSTITTNMTISSVLLFLAAIAAASFVHYGASAFHLPSSLTTQSKHAILASPRCSSIAFPGGPSLSAASIQRTTRLYMGWGPEPIWSMATVQDCFQACPSGSCVSLRVNVEDGTAFLYPGQYVQVKPGNAADEVKPIFLAIASAPTGKIPPTTKKTASEADAAAGAEASSSNPIPATWEFLVKKSESNQWLTSAISGSILSLSQPMGSGFPIKENIEGFKYDFPTQNLLLFATGSGIAPIRSAIESRQLNLSPPNTGGRTCTLYYGVRTPDDISYVSKFAEWESLGVQVVPVISQPDLPCESGAVWRGRTGYVQNALEEDGIPIPRNSGALLCGVKGMCESVKSMLLESGVFDGRILTNF